MRNRRLNIAALRKLLRSILRITRELIRRFQQRMIDLRRFVITKDRLIQAGHQGREVIFVLLTTAFNYQAYTVRVLIVVFCDPNLTVTYKLLFFLRCPMVQRTIAFFLYAVWKTIIWDHLPTRTRIRGFIYRTFQLPIEIFLERFVVRFERFSQSARGVRLYRALECGVFAVLFTYIITFLRRVPPPYPPWWVPPLFRLHIFVFMVFISYIVDGP